MVLGPASDAGAGGEVMAALMDGDMDADTYTPRAVRAKIELSRAVVVVVVVIAMVVDDE